MNNLQKRILTSIIALPTSLFFIFAGGYTLLFFLLTIFFIGNYELFSVFKKKNNNTIFRPSINFIFIFHFPS
tara:strand:- start:4491 stop:4706 length:216 start_codon:yes stop_codon:yes gene_type:complete